MRTEHPCVSVISITCSLPGRFLAAGRKPFLQGPRTRPRVSPQEQAGPLWAFREQSPPSRADGAGDAGQGRGGAGDDFTSSILCCRWHRVCDMA